MPPSSLNQDFVTPSSSRYVDRVTSKKIQNYATSNDNGRHAPECSDILPNHIRVDHRDENIHTFTHRGSRLPLADCTNLAPKHARLKAQNKKDSTVLESISADLFGPTSTEMGDDVIDYQNIDHSRVHGFSDSDADTLSCRTDTDSESMDDESETNVFNKPPCAKSNFPGDANGLTDHQLWCKKMISEVPDEYASLGSPSCVCKNCGAQMWKEERANKDVTHGSPEFNLCCFGGRVILPPIKPTPPFLKDLYEDKIRGPTFRRCVRQYNTMFSFTSMGGKVDDSINKGGAPYIYRLNGQNHHKIGSLLPGPGEQPKFCQLYIYDTENEVENRMRWINVKDTHNVDPEVVEGLLNMLDETNYLVKCFRMARDRFKEEEIVELKIVLKQSRSESGRENHIGDSDEVAAIMVGDMDETCGGRDIVVESKIDGLQRISDIHPLLMALQYPLLFPYGEDGFHEKMYYIKQTGDENRKRVLVSQRRFYASRLMVKLSEVEYLNSLRMPGLPAHDLKLKPGLLVMLMRNLNQTLGLCNGTRLIVRRCMTNAVQCEVICGPHVGTVHFIPKMELSPSDTTLPFNFIRRQFPLQVCYVMTINKAQGQSLQVVGLYLPNSVFSHGQLYVALSRVTSAKGLNIVIDKEEGGTTNITSNVVYQEVFYNLPKQM